MDALSFRPVRPLPSRWRSCQGQQLQAIVVAFDGVGLPLAMSVRVRFAPSPTGYLHIGGARTALFNWLFARRLGGAFVLRIEDTDVARNSKEAVEVILGGLRWLGLEWDEGPLTGELEGPSRGGHGPYFQSQRQQIYRRHVETLLSRGLAREEGGAIKFCMTREPVLIADLVVGQVKRQLTDREQEDPDFVIVRADGQPVFHLVNVVDDLEMGITHVIRGEDHLSNTAKHIALFRALDAPVPQYAHIPLILNADGTKMSKRDTGASLSAYVEEGFVPAAVVNYLCLLGWSPKGNREVMPVEEIIGLFDLPQILRHNARFDMEKLRWMNYEYMQNLSPEQFHEGCARALAKAGCDLSHFPPAYLRAAFDTCKGKLKVFSELPAYAGFYFAEDLVYDAEAARKEFVPENRARLRELREAFAQLNDFSAASLEAGLKSLAARLGIKPGLLVHPARLACTGKGSGPSLYHLLEVLGKERVLARLDRALTRM
jgi:glutamyl-tRNA synthetase